MSSPPCSSSFDGLANYHDEHSTTPKTSLLGPSPRIDATNKADRSLPASSSDYSISSVLSSSITARRSGPPSLLLQTSTPTSPKASSVHNRSSQSDFTSPTRTASAPIAIPISPRQTSYQQSVFATPSNGTRIPHSKSNESTLSYLTGSSSDDMLGPQRYGEGSASSPASPVTVDRSKLIGLGELATPRWTAATSRWAFSPDSDGKQQVCISCT